MKEKQKSALIVMDGVEQPDRINVELVRKLKSKRAGQLSAKDYFDGIRQGNRTILSKAITLIESALPKDRELAQQIITECLRITNSEFIPIQDDEIRNPKSEIRNPKSEIRNPKSQIPAFVLELQVFPEWEKAPLLRRWENI